MAKRFQLWILSDILNITFNQLKNLKLMTWKIQTEVISRSVLLWKICLVFKLRNNIDVVDAVFENQGSYIFVNEHFQQNRIL